MRALVCHRLAADRSGLRLEPAWPDPLPPQEGELCVEIGHAALNFPDLLMLSGGYQAKPALPFIPGSEASGIVVAAGADVAERLGERVIVGGLGCLAERITVPSRAARRVPGGLGDAEAAAFTVGALTAWVGLMVRGGLRTGERVLVTGAGGGMGLAAVALAAHEGARVIAAASSVERLEAARAAGAHETLLIDRARPDFAMRDVDVVFDPVGGALCRPAIRTLRRGGRYLVIGFAGGMPPPFPLNLALLNEIAVVGVRAGETGRQDPAAGRAHIAAIDTRASALKPLIGLAVALEAFDAAFAAMASGLLVGKAVVSL